LLVEAEPFHNGPDIGRKGVDIAVEIRGKLVGVVQKAAQIELGEVVKGAFGDLMEAMADDRFRLGFQFPIFGQDLFFGGSQQAIEAPQDRERQNDFTVFVPFVGAAEEIADAPNKIGELGMDFNGHAYFPIPFFESFSFWQFGVAEEWQLFYAVVPVRQAVLIDISLEQLPPAMTGNCMN
jgi:hypothetical protein